MIISIVVIISLMIYRDMKFSYRRALVPYTGEVESYPREKICEIHKFSDPCKTFTPGTFLFASKSTVHCRIMKFLP